MKLTRKSLNPENLPQEEALFSTANGYLGVRGCFEEGYTPSVRGCYVNGFYDTVKLSYPEKLYGFPEEAQRMVNLPDVQDMKLYADGEAFNPFEGKLTDYKRELDTRKGTATRSMKWIGPKGKAVDVNILRMASFVRPNLFLTVYDVSLPDGGEIMLTSHLNCNVSNYINPDDPRVASEEQRHILLTHASAEDKCATARCRTSASGLEIALCQMFETKAEVRMDTCENGVETVIAQRLKPGEKLRVEKYSVITDSRRASAQGADAQGASVQGEDYLVQHAKHLARECAKAGSDYLCKEQAAYLSSFWQTSAVEIGGDEALNEGMEYNLYMLLASAGRDAVSSVAAKGLSGEGYEGHYFWDTDVYIVPFFALTQPPLARKLLEYRYHMLPAAREHARIMGHSQGALYPWRTISGSECSPYFPSGSAQYHINGDVAHSVVQYYRLTGDDDFMNHMGREILLETARLWLSVGSWSREGRFCVNSVTGPDEYSCIVNNNYYTNLTARHNLLAAAEFCDIAREERQAFLQAAEKMYLPFDEKLGIHAQDDSFLDKPLWDLAATPKEHFPLLLHYHPLQLYRHQVCKQADTVLAHFLFEDGTSEDILRKSYAYYEKVTTHDSSLSTCVFSIMAARLGMVDKAYDYFMRTVRADLDNIQGNTKDGIHTANMGGAYMCLTFGFAGLRLKEEGLRFRFTLPKQWTGYSFKLWYKESLLRVTVDKNGGRVETAEGPPVKVFIDGEVS